MILTHEKIAHAVNSLLGKYSITKASYFGSYASGNATAASDLDILVEFTEPFVSFGRIIDIKLDLEDILGINVDVIHAPIPDDSFLEIDKTVVIYEN